MKTLDSIWFSRLSAAGRSDEIAAQGGYQAEASDCSGRLHDSHFNKEIFPRLGRRMKSLRLTAAEVRESGMALVTKRSFIETGATAAFSRQRTRAFRFSIT